jgi:hypothetical protein
MFVDSTDDGLVAATASGIHGSGRVGAEGDRWHMSVPSGLVAAGRLHDLEDLVGLALTTGWRSAGWVPLHAAAVANGDRVALICSESGGGKSTLTVAMVQHGWRTLGDDKLLLRIDASGAPEVRSLLSTFNLHPRTHEWVPQVGPLDGLPRYSIWTDKRRVRVKAISPGAMARRARPTHLVHLVRGEGPPELRMAALSPTDVTSTLLRQVVFPTDPTATRPMLDTLAKATGHLRGRRVEIGPDAYRHNDVAAALEMQLT